MSGTHEVHVWPNEDIARHFIRRYEGRLRAARGGVEVLTGSTAGEPGTSTIVCGGIFKDSPRTMDLSSEISDALRSVR